MQLSDEDKLNALRLIRSENVGPITYRQLIERYGSAKNALEQLPDIASRGGRKNYKVCPKSDALAEIDAIDKIKGHLICLGDQAYPKYLSKTEDAPPTLCALGHIELLHQDMLAMVGARNASANGCLMARKFAHQLALGQGEGSSLAIVSGMARGIDRSAHEGALHAAENQGNSTIAVMAGGVSHIYPSNNADIYKRIVELGVAISEHPPHLEPQARHFPRRNRIISGLSLGVLVVEAALKSGSLITARLAADQGREVFAIPGSPMDARSKGTNDLIRNGATLVESPEDIFFALHSRSSGLREIDFDSANNFIPPQIAGKSNDPDIAENRRSMISAKIMDMLTTAPVPVDEIIRHIDFSAQELNACLLELELAGSIQRNPGNRVSLMLKEEDFL